MKKAVNFLEKMFFLLKSKITIYGIIAIVVLIPVILILTINKNQEDILVIQKSNFIQQVSAAGKVIPASSVELSFKNSGRVDRINYSVDDVVKSGALIAQINATDAIRNVRNAEISLANAKLSLQKVSIDNSVENVSSDLEKAYDDGFTAVSDAFIDLPSVVTGLHDLLGELKLSQEAARSSGDTALEYREQAEKLFYKAKNVFDDTRVVFRTLDRDSETEQIEIIINETYSTSKLVNDAVKSFINFTDYLAEDSNDSSVYTSFQNTLSGYTNTMNGHVSSLLSSKTDIKDNKDIFSTSDLDIQSAQLDVQEKENALWNAQSELADYYIRAPFDGVITKIDAKIGEIASSNVPLVSMMSVGTYQIESFIPEVNISKIKVNNQALVTLDAYGDDVQFNATVVSIDPAETIKDGVSTYKIKLQFTDRDERIKSGMTANVMITVFEKPDTIVIPGGIIFEKNNKEFVQIKKDKEYFDREIITGETSALGQVEVISGLFEGDEVVFNPKI